MIEMRGVTVRYRDLTALDRLDLTIGQGEVFGYIGPNGAGKSTTMKVLACLLQADEGKASVCGLDVRDRPQDIRRILGYMPDFLGIYDDLTVDEYLQFFAAAYGIPRKRRGPLVGGVLELTDLTEKRHAMVDSLSRGMQQRLGVARVLVHDPKVLLLDEPASGLDPRARIEMRSLLTELRSMGKTIVVSSHILSELHEMCTSIGIIERGRLLFAGRIEDAFDRATSGEVIGVRLENGPDAGAVRDRAVARLREDARVRSAAAEGEDLVVELATGEHPHHFIIDTVVAAGGRIRAFTPRTRKLEDVFLNITKGQVQ
ncbi:MAG: ABC transporter ATP-binding protein [Phycisphaerales bacterium]|nr:ABC transporter ATP-binding protein [Phycisphaerales bacterium]